MTTYVKPMKILNTRHLLNRKAITGNKPSVSATNILRFNDVRHHVGKIRLLFRPHYPALLLSWARGVLCF